MSAQRLQCAMCGRCSVVCPVYRVTGRESLTARGKMHLLSGGLAVNPSATFEDVFSQCLLCGACQASCPRKLPLPQYVMEARSTFSSCYGQHGLRKTIARNLLTVPALLTLLVKAGIGLQRLEALPADSGLRLKLGLLESRSPAVIDEAEAASQTQPASQEQLSYFTGCFARYLQPSINESTVRLAKELTGEQSLVVSGQGCCGLAARTAGSLQESRRLARTNLDAFAAGSGPILTSCSSCYTHLKSYPTLFPDGSAEQTAAKVFSARVVEFSAFFEKHFAHATTFADKNTNVWYHDPCHLRFRKTERETPRRLLAKIDGITMIEPQDEGHCCGQGGLFRLGYEDLSEQIFQRGFTILERYRPDMIVTGCSGCLLQFRLELGKRGSVIKVLHPVSLLAGCRLEKER